MITTCNFATMKNLPEGYVPVAVSMSIPTGMDMLAYKKLAPEYSALRQFKQTGDELTFIERYYSDVLDNLDPFAVYQHLQKLTGSADVALVCYEKSSDFCHRHLILGWFRGAGVPCTDEMGAYTPKGI